MLCCTACAAWHCMCRSLAGTNMGVLLNHQRAVTPTVQKAWWGATYATSCPCAQGEHGHSGRVCAGHYDQRAGHPEPRVRALGTLVQDMSSRTKICWCGAVQFFPTTESTCGLACREIRIRQLIIGGINSDWPVPVRVSHGAGSLTDMSTQCPAHQVTSYVRTYVTAGALKRGDTLRRRSRTWTGCRQDWTPRTFKTACCHSACLPMLPMLQAPMEADCCTRFAQRPSMGRRHASQKPHAVARPRWAAAAPTLHRPAPCGCAARRPARPAARPAAPARPRPRPPPPRGTARARPPAPPPPARAAFLGLKGGEATGALACEAGQLCWPPLHPTAAVKRVAGRNCCKVGLQDSARVRASSHSVLRQSASAARLVDAIRLQQSSKALSIAGRLECDHAIHYRGHG